jgi:hypothetical protein
MLYLNMAATSARRAASAWPPVSPIRAARLVAGAAQRSCYGSLTFSLFSQLGLAPNTSARKSMNTRTRGGACWL